MYLLRFSMFLTVPPRAAAVTSGDGEKAAMIAVCLPARGRW